MEHVRTVDLPGEEASPAPGAARGGSLSDRWCPRMRPVTRPSIQDVVKFAAAVSHSLRVWPRLKASGRPLDLEGPTWPTILGHCSWLHDLASLCCLAIRLFQHEDDD